MFDLRHIAIYLAGQLPRLKSVVFMAAVLTFPLTFSPGILGWLGVPAEWSTATWFVSQLCCAIVLALSAPYWLLRRIDLTEAPGSIEHEREPKVVKIATARIRRKTAT